MCHAEGNNGQYRQYTLSHTQQSHQETEGCKPRTIQSLAFSQVTAVGGPIAAVLHLFKMTMKKTLVEGEGSKYIATLRKFVKMGQSCLKPVHPAGPYTTVAANGATYAYTHTIIQEEHWPVNSKYMHHLHLTLPVQYVSVFEELQVHDTCITQSHTLKYYSTTKCNQHQQQLTSLNWEVMYA